MYDYISGTLVSVDSDAITIDVNGVGFRILISKIDYTYTTHSSKKIWVEYVVREDSQTLYGFDKKEEREFFRLLQLVGGIGPKLALSLLGAQSSSEIAQAILEKNSKTLCSLPGVGKKLAERIIIELHERVEKAVASGLFHCSDATTHIQEALQALRTLGFSQMEAREALTETQKQFPEMTSVEQLIHHTLTKRK